MAAYDDKGPDDWMDAGGGTEQPAAPADDWMDAAPAAPSRPFHEAIRSAERTPDGRVSPKGATSPMQVIPRTAGDPGYGVKPAQNKSPEEYVRVGNDYAEALLKHYNNETLAGAAYNAGPGTVDKWLKTIGDPRTGKISEEDFGKRIPYPETRTYVENVRKARGAPASKDTDPGDWQDAAPETAQASPYDTKLSPEEEAQFQIWKQQNAPNDTGEDYDLRGAFKEGLARDPASQHMSDQFKKPNHPTFSDESQYGKPPFAAASKAGHWSGPQHDVYVPPGAEEPAAQTELSTLHKIATGMPNLVAPASAIAGKAAEAFGTDSLLPPPEEQKAFYDATAKGLKSIGLEPKSPEEAKSLQDAIVSQLPKLATAAANTGVAAMNLMSRAFSAALAGGHEGAVQVFQGLGYNENDAKTAADDLTGYIESVALRGGEQPFRAGSARMGERGPATPHEQAAGAFTGATAEAYNKPLMIEDQRGRPPEEAAPPEPPRGPVDDWTDVAPTQADRFGSPEPAPAAPVEDWADVPQGAAPAEVLYPQPEAPSAPVENLNTPPAFADRSLTELEQMAASGTLTPEQLADVGAEVTRRAYSPTVSEAPSAVNANVANGLTHATETSLIDAQGEKAANSKSSQQLFDERGNRPAPPGPVNLRDLLNDKRKLSEIRAEREAAIKASEPAPGTREEPAPANDQEAMDLARTRVEANPSEAQKEAGNYTKAHVDFHGMDFTMETPKGAVREGPIDEATGKPKWTNIHPDADYGYIKRTEGADGDQLDLYIGPNPASKKVFVVDQYDPKTGKFDEHKPIGGVDTQEQAIAIYDKGFSDGSGPSRRKGVTEMPIRQFKQWATKGDTSKPLVKVKTVRQAPKLQANIETDLIQTIRAHGGIRVKDPDGTIPKEGQEIMAVLKDFRRPGLINNKTGMRPDAMRKTLREQGWFGGRGDQGEYLTDLHALLEGAVQGQKVHHPESKAAQAQLQADQEAQEGQARIEIEALGKKHGAELSNDDIDAVIARMQESGIDAESAIHDHLERAAITDLDADARDNPNEDYEIPFGELAEADRQTGEGVQGPEGQTAEPPQVGEVGQEPQGVPARPQEALQAPLVEAGAEGLPQTIIPGAERMSEQEIARRQKLEANQRGMVEMKLKQQQSKMRKGGQQAAGGMFDEGRNQTDLLAQPNAKEGGSAPGVVAGASAERTSLGTVMGSRGAVPAPNESKKPDRIQVETQAESAPTLNNPQGTRSDNVPYTFESFAQDEAKLRQGDMTAEQAMNAFERIVASEAALKAELLSFPKDRLAKMNPRDRNETKQRIVDGLYSSMLNSFNAGGTYSWSPFSASGKANGPVEGIRKAMEKQTDASIKEAAEKRKAYAAERVKTYTNPETLSQFEDFVRVRGMDKLTAEQRAKFDDLKAEAGRAEVSRETTRVNPLKATTETKDIIETKHTQKGHALFVVQLPTRVEKDAYVSYNNAAKALGGYYSRYAQQGAVPGFQFKSREAAEQFKAVLSGETSLAKAKQERVAEKTEEKKETAVEHLRDMAESLGEKADESMGRDRLANTNRRARMAAGAEAQAAADKALATTMKNLADAIESGEAKNLGSVRTKADVEMLDGLARTARVEWVRAQIKADPSLRYEKLMEQPISREMIEKAKFPYPWVHREELGSLIKVAKTFRGSKLASNRLAKELDAIEPDEWRIRTTNLGDMDDLQNVATAALQNTLTKYQAETVLETFKEYRRVVAMGLREPASLRAALREFLEYRGKTAKADPLKAAERALVGAKYEGYFPTPKPLAKRMVDAAGIQPGDSVLEPSAGKGDIADAVKAAHPEAKVSVIEPVQALRNILEMKGHTIVGSDFLEQRRGRPINRIVMNPPFEKGQDVDHVMHAYHLLEPGGRIVAIMGEHPFFASDKKSEEFRQWLDEQGGTSEKLPEGSFAQGDRPTGVNTRLVIIDKSNAKFQAREARGFYSALTKGIYGIKMEKAPAIQWRNTIKNLPGVKQEERDWSGLEQWLEGQKGVITKDQVLDQVRQNNVQVHETVLGGVGHDYTVPDEMAQEEYKGQWDQLNAKIDQLREEEKSTRKNGLKSSSAENIEAVTKLNQAEDAREELHDQMVADTRTRLQAKGMVGTGPAKYETYRLPGGENYRELLLTIPRRPPPGEARLDAINKRLDEITSMRASEHAERPELRDEFDKLRAERAPLMEEFKAAEKQEFQDPHWPQKNVVVHVRMDDRTGPNGEKVLHLAEIQSGWHQGGRKRGYVPKLEDRDRLNAPVVALRDDVNEMLKRNDWLGFETKAEARNALATEPKTWDLESDEDRKLAERWSEARMALHRFDKARMEGIPDAPFKTTWHELALKRMLRYAAENGYDRLSWDTGATNADRYDLSRQVDSIIARKQKNGEYSLAFLEKGASSHTISPGLFTEKELVDQLGKDLADKVVEKAKTTEPGHAIEFSGLDLKLGGTGMTGFYDKILPDFMNKYAKKWGAKVEEGSVQAPGRETADYYGVEQNKRGEYEVRRLDSTEVVGTYDLPGLANRESRRLNAEARKGQTTPTHSVPITPQMRDSVMAGQPLFNAPAPFGRRTSGIRPRGAEGRPGEPVRLAPGVTAVTPGNVTATEKAVMDQIAALAKEIIPTATVRPMRSIEAGGSGLGENRLAEGVAYGPNRSIIAWAMEGPDAVGTLRHEALHFLRDYLSDEEWQSLVAAARRGNWMKDHQIDGRYPGLNYEAKMEEAIAEELSQWRRFKKTGLPEAVRAIFQRIAEFLAKVAAYVRKTFGLNKTANDIFSDIMSGKTGREVRPGRFSEEGPKFQAAQSGPGRQRAMQGFIARGQPFERGIRIPFDIFGGIEKGEWKPGKYVTKEARRILREAEFKPEGKFSFVNDFLFRARSGLLDRYGQSPEYIERSKAVALDKAKIEIKAAETLKTLADMNITPEEAQMLQSVLTGEAVPDEKWAKVAQPIREAIDELGAEAVELGLISAESYERNRGSYLHRVYLKDEADTGRVKGLAKQFFSNRRRRIIGSEMKGRGIFQDVPKTTVEKDLPGFISAERGKPVKFEKVRMLDKFAETQGLPEVGAPAAKPIKRVFVSASEPIPEKFADYTDRGEWEIRAVKGDSYTLWRDYTKEERTKMGEILDARYTLGKTFALMTNDLSTGRFFKDIATNAEWTRNDTPNTKWVDSSEYSRHWADPSVEWVKVSDSTIPKTGAKKKWGALAGKYVRAEIWRDLNELDQMQQSNFWRSALNQWKLNKTARSPVVHMNNIISNVWLMDMADVRMQDLVTGVKAYVGQSADFLEAKEAGAFGGDMMSQEIKKTVLDPILKDLQAKAAGGQIDSQLSTMTKLLDQIWTKAKALDNGMVQAYRMEDEIFRMATYMRRRTFGDSPADAARTAREQFIDYDIRAPWVNTARQTVLPFAAYTYRAVPLLAKAMTTRPWKLAKYVALGYAANLLAYMLSPGDEDEERRSLREQQQGYTWLGSLRMMRMPYRDQWGNPVFLDVRRWIPAGDVFDMNQGSSAIPIPAPLQFGGPLMMAAELFLNKQGFTGEEIRNTETDTPWDATKKVGDYAWKAWVPGAAWMPGSWYWQRISLAAQGATDFKGTPYSIPQAVASSFGIKVQPQDVDLGFAYHSLAFRKIEDTLRTEARALGRDYELGRLSQAQFNSGMAAMNDKLVRLGSRQTRTMLGDAAGKAFDDFHAGKIQQNVFDRIIAEAAAKQEANQKKRQETFVPRPVRAVPGQQAASP